MGKKSKGYKKTLESLERARRKAAIERAKRESLEKLIREGWRPK